MTVQANITDVKAMKRKQQRNNIETGVKAGNIVKTIDSTCRNTKTVINKHDQRNISLERYALRIMSKQGTVVTVGDGNIIRRFEKTPIPRKNTDVICPHFSMLAWAHGCPGHCSWCYIQGTFRWESYKTVDHSVPPKLKDREEIEKAVTTFLDAPNMKPHLLNSGELGDCYDDVTEILTEEGWKLFDELTYQDKVATRSPEDMLEYQNPTQIIKEYYKGKMLSISTEQVELVVTPKHNLWIAVRQYEPSKKSKETFSPFHLERAYDAVDKRMKMKKSAIWIGQEQATFELKGNPNARYSRDRKNIQIAMETWLEFFGYFLSEGSSYLRNDTKHRYRVTIAQSKQENPERYEKIKQCLMRLPMAFHEYDDGFYCDSQHLTTYLIQFGQAENKFIPKEIKNLNPRLLKILTDALILGDGAYNENNIERTYYSCSKRLADDVQELLLKIGSAGNISIKQEPGYESEIRGRKITAKNTLYAVNITHRYLEPVINHGHGDYKGRPHTSWSDYEGFIYCCTVPNHIVFVRHGGKPVWSGNSLMTERGKQPFSEFIMPFFKGTRHKVLFLSKMTDVQHFLENEWQKNAILSWSINAVAIANRFEKRMPDPMERIKAAKLVSDAGYTVRVRLDPMVPVEDWPRHYGDIIGSVCENFKPERVTLGTLRGLASTIAASKDREWVKYLTESSNWGRKPSLETRLAMYSFAIESFRKRGIRKIAVCKDTKQIWNVLKTKYGLDYHKMMCNCLP